MTSRSIARALVAAAVLAASAAAAVVPARAADLDDLRTRAQRTAEQVSALEQELAGLDARRRNLQVRIDQASRDIAALELSIRDAEEARRAAQARFVERAVATYKAGPILQTEVLLSARDFEDLYMANRAAAEIAAADAAALAELVAAQALVETNQERVDERKQRLLLADARLDLVGFDIAANLRNRRDQLTELTDQVAELEAEARRQARLAAQPADALLALLAPAGPAPDIPDGFASTGVAIEGTASWYGPGFEGRRTASGDIFDSSLFTAASKELPLGTWLYVQHAGKGVVVLVNDRGPYVKDWILDLSHASAQAIGITGIGWVRAEILIEV